MSITFGRPGVSGLGSSGQGNGDSAPVSNGLGTPYSTERDWRSMVPEAPAVDANYTPPVNNGQSYYQQQLEKQRDVANEESPYADENGQHAGSYDYTKNNPISDNYQANPYEAGTDQYYNDSAFTMYLPDNPNQETISFLRNNPYMDQLIYSDEWLNREYHEDLPSYMDYGSPSAAMSHAYGARLGQGKSWEGTFEYGYALGGVVQSPEFEGYGPVPMQEGGEIIPSEGLSEFEEALIQGAIRALTGEIEDQSIAEEILMELEATFGQGAVEELANEIQAQSGNPAGGGDGMDDSVSANLSPGEVVVSNPQLADYGGGDREIGAEKLMAHLDEVSKAHRGTSAKPQRVNPAALA